MGDIFLHFSVHLAVASGATAFLKVIMKRRKTPGRGEEERCSCRVCLLGSSGGVVRVEVCDREARSENIGEGRSFYAGGMAGVLVCR